jgi:N4-gp56 family major capsid protein
MATGATKTADIGFMTEGMAIKSWLKPLVPQTCTDAFAEVYWLEKNSSTTIKLQRMSKLTRLSAPLVEGVTPTAQKIENTRITVTVQQWGGFVETSDVIDDSHEGIGTLKTISARLGEQAGETIEVQRFSTLQAATNVFRTNGSAKTDVNTPPTAEHFALIRRNLENNYNKPFLKLMTSNPNYGTYAVSAAYWVIVHPDLVWDVEQMTGFKYVADYAKPEQAHPMEIGAIPYFRFISTPLNIAEADAGGTYNETVDTISTTGVKSDIYYCIVLAREAYAVVPLRGRAGKAPNNVNMYTTPVNKAEKSDPIAQTGTVGWKCSTACVILDQAKMAVLQAAATETPSVS